MLRLLFFCFTEREDKTKRAFANGESPLFMSVHSPCRNTGKHEV